MNDTKEVIRILHIVSSMDRGGAETLIMNIYRNIDRTKFQFDFITHSPEKEDYEDEITSLGGNIYKIKSLGTVGPLKYLRALIEIMSSNTYISIHAHTDFQGGFPSLAAKICGIKTRICHSHSNSWLKGNDLKNRIVLKILRTIIKFTATDYCACSIEAAQFLFGKKWVNQGRVDILKNGIEIEQFLRLGNNKQKLLEELNLPKNAKILGHVGKFSQSKNHRFILKVLKNLLSEDPAFVVLFIGDGPLKDDIEKEALELGLMDNIRFLGVRSDIPSLMRTFDVFIFPSIFEGFGIVTLEAQCSATPCIVSDSISKTTDMGLGLMTFIDLNNDISIWASEIKKAMYQKKPDNTKIYINFQNKGYDIHDNVLKWQSLYLREKQNMATNIL